MVLRITLFWMLLVGSALSAETNYVYVSGSMPLAHGPTCAYDVEQDSVSIGDMAMSAIDWSVVRVVRTTSVIPTVFTNIAQVAILDTVWPVNVDEKKNWERVADKKLKAIITGLVKTINLRLPAGQKITAEELKAAIKAEL